MANGRPPCSAYRELMLGRLIFLKKCPVVWPVGVGETWRRMLAKCVLAVTGDKAKEACNTEKLCRVLEAGTEGGIQQCVSYDISTPRRRTGFFPH